MKNSGESYIASSPASRTVCAAEPDTPDVALVRMRSPTGYPAAVSAAIGETGLVHCPMV